MSIFPYLSVEKHAGRAVLKVERPGQRAIRYPLTPTGCRQAGRELHAAGHAVWHHASSVNHPTVVKPGFRGDVTALVQGGWCEANDAEEVVGQGLARKIADFCAASARVREIQTEDVAETPPEPRKKARPKPRTTR